MNNVAVEISINGNDHSSPVTLAGNNDWQYIVFDLTENGFEGDLQTMRIDWQKAANEAGNTMLISDIFFASSEAFKDAILEGKYVYPIQEILEPETEAPTEAPTDPVTAPEVETSEDTSDGGDTKALGCASSLATASAIAVALAGMALPLLIKKKED
jgi:hypothetical protein